MQARKQTEGYRDRRLSCFQNGKNSKDERYPV